jgi:hypothetical protein
MRKINFFKSLGVLNLNNFILENSLEEKDIINIETFIEYEKTSVNYASSVKKTYYILWYYQKDLNEK